MCINIDWDDTVKVSDASLVEAKKMMESLVLLGDILTS